MVDFVCGEQPGLDKLCEIVRILRSPEGCPWDREQDHRSLRSAMLEEAHEAVDAIDSGEAAALCEELGDVLLQVVFHSRLAEETGSFTLNDVIGTVCAKLIQRHPHVFGETRVDGSEQVLRNWDSIKRAEKSFATKADALRGVPRSFPALLRADKLITRAARAGYTEAPGPTEPLTEPEAGELLWEAVRRVHAAGADPELALHRRLERLIDDFETWENTPG